MRDSQGNPLRTVWILGAGFSRSLGGPLLMDLFRQETLPDLSSKYPSTVFSDLAKACYWTQLAFNWGKYREDRWEDAEAFADYVDCARERSPEAASLLSLCRRARELDGGHSPLPVMPSVEPPGSIGDLQGLVVRALAAECSWFARNRAGRPERWDPYQRWADSLDAGYDTIVSFNYDQVVEQLDHDGRRIVDVLPGPPAAELEGRVPLLKLHGSVRWYHDGESCRREFLNGVLGCPPGLLVLGTPGSTKRKLKDSILEPLWTRAEAAIATADAIVFLGYRFPESDSDARRRILGAIRSNSAHRLRCQVVLGLDPNSPDAKRALRMLEVSTRLTRNVSLGRPSTIFTRKTAELWVEPLFAQDYLALYGEDGPLSLLP